jgi:hypothetical protein
MAEYTTIPFSVVKNKKKVSYHIQVEIGPGGDYNLGPYNTVAVLMDSRGKILHFGIATRLYTDKNIKLIGVKTAIETLLVNYGIFSKADRAGIWEQILPKMEKSVWKQC